jgi:hypothetical protein
MCDRSHLPYENAKKSYREMTLEEKRDYRARQEDRVQEAVQKTYCAILDNIFAGKKTVTRALAERRLRAKRAGHD